jgi:phage terminase large subunit-like protein
MRLHQQSILFENGQIFLPEKAHWLSDYVHEVTSFPTGKHDDQVDSTTQALALIREEMDEPSIIGYYRMLLEERSRGIYN